MRPYIIILVFFYITSCSMYTDRSDGPGDIKKVKYVKVIPKKEKLSKYGNPSTYKVFGKTYKLLSTHIGYEETGFASWYGKKFHGRLTSSREKYDMYKFTAAHKTLPIPCYVSVKNLENGKSIIVRVNDRGPFVEGRIIDLSFAAAKILGVFESGTARVLVKSINIDGKK